MANVVTITNRTANAVELTNANGAPVTVPAYGTINTTLDDPTYAAAVNLFGAVNVVLATANAGGLSSATVPYPDWAPPYPPAFSNAGYTGGDFPVLQAILAELRVLSLLIQQNSAPNVDLASMRADEVNNATGGVLN